MSAPIYYPATKTVHWVTGPVHACDKHTRALVGLASVLGVHVGVTAAPDDSECSNCVHEAKKKASDAGGEG